MPIFERGDTRIHFSEHGSGTPLLAIAPGGMRSAADAWGRVPWNPVVELAGTHRVIVMDQRNAGSSTAPVTGAEGWPTYLDDQLALLDHLGVERFQVAGMCIGGAYLLGLLQAAPERVDRALALQPIGLDGNRELFHRMFDDWSAELAPTHPEAGPEQWEAYREAMYGGDDRLFTVPDAFLPTVTAPVLVLQGDDEFHPRSASRLLASSVPGATLVERWKEPADFPAAREVVREFLVPFRP